MEVVKEKNEVLGHLQNLKMDIDKPIQMKFEIEYKNLNLLTGLNGSGKSLIMKLGWSFETILSILITNPPSANEAAQYILDKTFENQDFNGNIEATFKKGTLKLCMDNGKVSRAEFFIDPAVKVISPSIYMSTNTRTFIQINQFLKVEKLIKTEEELLSLYRLYDVIFVNVMKGKLKNGLKATQQFKESMSKNFDMKYDFDTFAIENDSVIFIDTNGKKTELSTLSAGEQSLINMNLASM